MKPTRLTIEKIYDPAADVTIGLSVDVLLEADEGFHFEMSPIQRGNLAEEVTHGSHATTLMLPEDAARFIDDKSDETRQSILEKYIASADMDNGGRIHYFVQGAHLGRIYVRSLLEVLDPED